MFRIVSRALGAALATFVCLFALTGPASAAVEVNSADPSQLESLKGIGPALSGKIVAERKQGNFKDWSDFEARVAGVGEKNAAGFSRNGLTVGGKSKDGAQATPDQAGSTRTPPKKVADGSTAALAKK